MINTLLDAAYDAVLFGSIVYFATAFIRHVAQGRQEIEVEYADPIELNDEADAIAPPAQERDLFEIPQCTPTLEEKTKEELRQLCRQFGIVWSKVVHRPGRAPRHMNCAEMRSALMAIA